MTESSRTPLHREDNLPVDNRRVLSGRYELGSLIGRGGMADVYRGTDTRLGRTVAIKLLRPDMARDPQFRARFKREAQAVAALNHPSIVAIFDTGEHLVHDGSADDVRVPYIVMEFVEGKTLRDMIRAKEVTIDQAIDYCLGVLGALEYSHKAGIVHRDIKPANVMYCPGTNSVKVMDFGIARAIADSSATMTQTQAVVGTAQYLSPEQARGETVDARSDLYSAACLLYEMLTSRPPFVGDSPVSVAYQHVREIAEPPSSLNPDVSPALDTVIAKALQKNRDDRFQDAAAFRRALRAAKAGVPVPAVAASEAPTDPNDHVPDAPPRTDAFAATGASFLDDAPTGRLAAAGLYHDDGTAIPLEVADAHTAAEPLPLGLPPEREPSRRQKSRRRAWIATLVIFTLLVLAGGRPLALRNGEPAGTHRQGADSLGGGPDGERCAADAVQREPASEDHTVAERHRGQGNGHRNRSFGGGGDGSGCRGGPQYLRWAQLGEDSGQPPRQDRSCRTGYPSPGGPGGGPVNHHGQQRHGAGRNCHHHRTPRRGRAWAWAPASNWWFPRAR